MRKICIWVASALATSFAHATVEVPSPDAVIPKGGHGYLWTGCDTCSSPESVYYDATTKTLFVSNIAGAPDQKDGVGWIQKLDVTGKVIAAKWVDGLNAPKGMRSHRGTLWVSDIDQLIAIEISSGKIKERHTIAGAKFLNDVAIDPRGTVYVSDTVGSAIYKLSKGKISTFASGPELESPNGLLVMGSHLVVASWGAGMRPDWSTQTLGHIYKLSLTTGKRARTVTRSPLGHLDGLELDSRGNFLVSDWVAGKIYRVSSNGKQVTELFTGMKNSADIGYIRSQQLLVIPRMGENQITAYDLKTYPKN